MANFEAKISAILDLSKAQGDLNSFISQMQSQTIKLNVDLSSANQALAGALSNIQSQSRSAGSSAGQQFAQSFTSSLNTIGLKNGGIGNIKNMLQGAGFDKSSIATATRELDKMSLTISKITTKQLANGNIRMNITGVDELNRGVTIVREFDKATGKVANTSKTFTQNFSQQFKNVGNSIQQTQSKVQKFNQTQAETFGNQMTAWARNNTKAVREYGDQIDNLQQRLRVAISNQDAGAVKEIRDEFRLLQSEARATGNVGKTIGEQFASAFGSVTKFAASYLSVYRVFQTLRDGVKTVVELDDALVDLQKTSTATPQQLSQFYKEANDYAKEYGTTTQQMIQGAADWSRLGYNLEESKEMSKLSSQFASISPGMSVEQSTSGLVSTMKSFGITTNEVLDGVMSKVNAVGFHNCPNTQKCVA